MKKTLIVLATTALLSTSTFANQNTGCGLGSDIVKNQDTVLLQLVATFLNGTSGNQTFGITSGTSGCEKPASFVSNDKAINFMENNMDALALDISNGQGESIDTLASLLDIKDTKAFGAMLQANFDKIYTDTDVNSAKVINNIVKVG
jgi:predicted small secreted protein